MDNTVTKLSILTRHKYESLAFFAQISQQLLILRRIANITVKFRRQFDKKQLVFSKA